MSDHADVQAMIATLPCSVELPANWTEISNESGQAGTCWDDHRRFRRHNCRSVAALECGQTLASFGRRTAPARVFVKDICRSGLGFLHGEQLFPGERITLTFPDGKEYSLQVRRCRRIKARCFEIGAAFGD
jgi:hypothetical protein